MRAENYVMTKPWEWRKASGGAIPKGRRIFHAHDVNDNCACEPHLGLMESCEEPNEGSEFCEDCIEVVKAMPAGREKRDYAALAEERDRRRQRGDY